MRPLHLAFLALLGGGTMIAAARPERAPAPTLAVADQDGIPVAVVRFDNNTGEARYDNLGRALAAMMISDLSVVEEIQLVERERLEELTAEMDFQQSAYVDPASAQTMGLMVGAEYVVTGAFVTADPEMRLDTRIVRVETTEIVKTADVSGPTNELFELQKRLADEFLDGLAVTLTEGDRERLAAQQERNRIDDLETAVAFSQALCFLDGGAYVEGFERIQEVRDRAPASAIVGLTLDLLKGKVEEEAKDELTSRANRAIGGLLGRGRRQQRPQRTRPTPSC